VRTKLAALLLTASAPFLALAVVACSHQQDLADWLRKADETCKRAQENADRNPAPQSPLPGDALRLSASRSRDELEELRALDPPTEQASAVAEYLIELGHRNDALEHYADDLDKAPAQGPLPSRSVLEETTTAAYTKAEALGLESCAGGIDFGVDTTTTTTSAPADAVTTVPSTLPDGTPGNQFDTPDGAPPAG
jgi:hypothetical protein